MGLAVHWEQLRSRDQSHHTWLRPMATLFFSRSSAWKSSSIACGEHQNITELLRRHLHPGMSLLKLGTETSGPYEHVVRVHPAGGHPVRVHPAYGHPAVLSFPPPHPEVHSPSPRAASKQLLQPQLFVPEGLSAMQGALGRMGKGNLQLLQL